LIDRLIIKNFRSLKDVDLKLGKINAFVGPNNSGKTNIMNALNIVLRDFYPSRRVFDDTDFFHYLQADIEITVIFDAPLASYPGPQGFTVRYDGNEFDYLATDSQGNTLQWPRGNDIRVSNDMRNEIPLMNIGINRQAYQQLRPTKWTIYGKILKAIDTQISELEKREYEEEVEGAYNTHLKPHLAEFERVMIEYTKQHTGLDLDFQLSTIDPTETLKGVRPYIRDDILNINFDMEKTGQGVQSALALALARAYCDIVKSSLILAIEEPELYLHPHGCRHFYSILQYLANNGFQIVYTTHNRSFIDIMNYRDIHLVRKTGSETVVTSGLSFTITPSEALKLYSMCDDRINEMFFADKVILVEGAVDQICCRSAFDEMGDNLDENNVSIIECLGKNEIIHLASILKNFKVECYTIFDGDAVDEIGEAETLLGAGYVFTQNPNDLEGMLGLPLGEKWKKKEAVIEAPMWFSSNPMPIMYTELKTKIFG